MLAAIDTQAPADAVTTLLRQVSAAKLSGNAKQPDAGAANTACSIFIFGLTLGLGTDINYKLCGG